MDTTALGVDPATGTGMHIAVALAQVELSMTTMYHCLKSRAKPFRAMPMGVRSSVGQHNTANGLVGKSESKSLPVAGETSSESLQQVDGKVSGPQERASWQPEVW